MKYKRITMGTLDWDKVDVIARVVEVVRSGNLSSGDEITEFECKVAALHGKRYGIFVNSGQSALEVSLVLAKKALGKDKLKVLMPATTYAADLWAILNTGNTPVFGDISLTDLCLLKDDTKECDVILPVDLCGNSGNRSWDLSKHFVIEDACQAFGNQYCYYGDIVCLSFYVSHHITTGCGGMLCTNDTDLAEYARSYIAHGRIFGGDFTKYTDRWVDRFSFDKIGASYRGDCIHAALGLSQLKGINDTLQKRRENATQLRNRLQEDPLFKFLPTDDLIKHSAYQFFPVILPSTVDRTTVLERLFSDYNIDSRVLFPLTTQPIFKELYGDISVQFPNSNIINEHGCIVGCHQGLDIDDMNYLAGALKDIVNET